MRIARLELHVRDEVYEYHFHHWPVHERTIRKWRKRLRDKHVKGNEPYEIYLIIQSKANDDLKT